MEKENQTSAETAVRELTLALLFLNRFREFEGKKNNRRYYPWQAWKNYDFDVLNELNDKDFIRGSRRAKSVTLSKAGMAEARRIIEKYGIADWDSLKDTEDWPSWLEQPPYSDDPHMDF